MEDENHFGLKDGGFLLNEILDFLSLRFNSE